MELLVWMRLCVLLFTQIVSARTSKRHYVTVDCNNFSRMMQDTKVCIKQHDNSILASGLILKTSQLEVLVHSMCSSLPEIRNCVNEKYGSCLNKDTILRALVGDGICQDQPNKGWLPDWYRFNPLVDAINDNCGREIEICTKQDWILEFMGSEFESLRFNESSSFLRDYSGHIRECIKPLFEDAEAICGDLELSSVTIMIDLQIAMMPLQILGNLMAD